MIEILLRQYLNGFRAEKILDVGPGYNLFARIVAEITGATQITYLDCDAKVLEWQRQECIRLGYKSEGILIPLDERDTPDIKGTFDIILCQEVFEHLVNAESILKSLVDVLGPNGRMVITVPTAFSERFLSLLNPAYMRAGAHGHVRRFGKKQISLFLEQAGLKPIVFIPTQPHVFLTHAWIFGTRMEVVESTGRIETTGWRSRIASLLDRYARKVFLRTNPMLWGRLLPRNYFIIAERIDHADSL